MKVSEIKDKFYFDVEQKAFDKIILSDPTSIIKDKVVVKLGKYCQWLLSLYKQQNLLLEDLYKATEYLKVFHNLKEKNIVPVECKDIFKYKSLPELFEINQKVGGTGVPDKNERRLLQDRYYINNGEANIHYEDKKWLIVKLNTLKASQFYAHKTQWCTRYPDMFNHYCKKGNLYVLINKKLIGKTVSKRRLQFHFPEQQYMNINDIDISLQKFWKENPLVLKSFINEFQNEIKKDIIEVKTTSNDLDCILQYIYYNTIFAYTDEQKRKLIQAVWENKHCNTDIFAEAWLLKELPVDSINYLIEQALNNLDTLNHEQLELFADKWLLNYGTERQKIEFLTNEFIEDCDEWIKLVKSLSFTGKRLLIDEFLERKNCQLPVRTIQALNFNQKVYHIKKCIELDCFFDVTDLCLNRNIIKAVGSKLIIKLILDKEAYAGVYDIYMILNNVNKKSVNTYFKNNFCPNHSSEDYFAPHKLTKINQIIYWSNLLKKHIPDIVSDNIFKSIPSYLRKDYFKWFEPSKLSTLQKKYYKNSSIFF